MLATRADDVIMILAVPGAGCGAMAGFDPDVSDVSGRAANTMKI